MLKTGSKTHLPLGYQTLDHPNENVCCDWPSCTLSNTEAEWFIFEGCWHAFHKICTGHVNYCLICNAHLKNETFRLATSAQSSIFGEHNAEKNRSSGDTRSIHDDDDDDENDFAIKISLDDISEEKSNDIISEISHKLVLLQPAKPDNSREKTAIIKVDGQTRPPHCKKCMHSSRGHSGKKSERKCNTCPGKVCSNEGTKIPCECSWHLTSSFSPDITETDLSIFKIGSVTKIILPWKYSQSGLANQNDINMFGGINSCYVISTIACLHSLNDSFLMVNDNHESLARQYIRIINRGNALYRILPKIDGNQNMYVEDIIQHGHLDLYMSEPWKAVMDLHDLLGQIERLSSQKRKVAMVLIINPDKAMAIIIKNENIYLFDSHFHHMKGAVIACAPVACLEEFCTFIEIFLKKYFNASTKGSNLLPLEVIENSVSE